MANLTNIPAIDWFETTLASSWNGAVWTVSVLDVPSGTIESGETSYIVVNPWKSNMQVAQIDGWNSWTKTFNVTNISVEKWNGVDYTAQSHAANSVVRFSNNYAFWKDIRTAVNSKAWTDTSNTWTWTQTFDKVITTGYTKDAIYADDTARDTAIPSPSNWMRVYNTAVWLFQKYQAGAWIDDTSWASTPNASTTVAGKVEKATQPETNAWTSIGGTGAELFVWPAELKTVTDWLVTPDASTTVKWKIEIATNTEVTTWTSTVLAVTPDWLPKTAILQTTRASDAASWSVTIAHWLSRTPKYIQITGVALTSTDQLNGTWIHSNWYSDWTNHKCSYLWLVYWWSAILEVWNSATNCIHFALWSSYASRLQTATASFDATNVTLVWTYNWLAGTTGTMHITILAVA